MTTAATGTIGGRYRLGEPLGRGGIGVVWRASDQLLQRDVAVKEVRFPAGLSDEERAALAERTLEEARQVAAIDIAAAVRVFDIVEQDGRPWVVMELVEGETLTDVLGREKQLPSAEVARIGLCLLEALEAAHRAGVVHRDVKPANVFVEGDGAKARLLDFGVAKGAGDADDPPIRTTGGSTLGSLAYMAPEQAGGSAEADARSDLYAVGSVLFRALAGRPPFAAKSAATMLALKLDRDAPSLGDVTGDKWPPPVESFLRGMLAREREKRFSNAEKAIASWEAARAAAIGDG